jgi:hypothetical protein
LPCGCNGFSNESIDYEYEFLFDERNSTKTSLEGVVNKKTILEGMVNKKTSLEGVVKQKTILEGMVDQKTALEGVVYKKTILEGIVDEKTSRESIPYPFIRMEDSMKNLSFKDHAREQFWEILRFNCSVYRQNGS